MSANLERLILEYGGVHCVSNGKSVLDISRDDLKKVGIAGVIETLNIVLDPQYAGGPDSVGGYISAGEHLSGIYGERWWEPPELEDLLDDLPVPDHARVKV